MAQRFIIIRHADGREYAVLPALFHAQYEPAGFVAVSYEDDGSDYVAPVRDVPADKPQKAAK